jgi:hypothetical protein
LSDLDFEKTEGFSDPSSSSEQGYMMSKPFFPERHLDSPILTVNVTRCERLKRLWGGDRHPSGVPVAVEAYIRSEPGFLEKRECELMAQVMRTVETTSGYKADMIPILRPENYSRLIRSNCPSNKVCEDAVTLTEAAIRPIIAAHSAALASQCGLSPESVPYPLITDQAIEEYTREEVYAFHIESYTSFKASGRKDPMVSTQPTSICVVSRGLCYLQFRTNDAGCWFLTYEQLLMLRDLHMMRKNAYISCYILYPGDSLLPHLMDQSFQWQEQCITEYGNSGYEIAKSCESLSKAYISRAAKDILSGPGDSTDLMIQKVSTKEQEMRWKTARPARREKSLAQLYVDSVLLPTVEIYQVVELFGLQKMSGHPMIDPYLSGKKAKEKACDPDTTTLADALTHRSTFCRLFCEAFVKKHHRWPKLEFSKKGTVLEKLYNGRVLSINKRSYPLRDWDYARFRKEFDFDYYENFLTLLDDKAISFYLSEKHLQWDKGKPTSERRLLLEILKRDHFSVKEIVDLIENWTIPEEWKICSLYPKEREFKEAARMFLMLVIEMRTFFTAHEANLADHVLPYMPQITMTDDKLSISQRFLDLTVPLLSGDIIRVLIELDLSSWNLMWRELVVNLTGSDINDLFGLRRVFTSVHKFFKECCVMTRVAGCRPPGVEKLWPQESDLIHYGHIGGFEGIAQKLWSICTVAMIEVAMASTDYQYSITDQGDNIVLAVTTRRDFTVRLKDQLKAVEKDVIKRCHESSKAVHQDLKPEECLSSTTVITYSKAVFVNGTDYPTAIKATSRLQPQSAIDFPSYGAYIQSIFAGALAASEVSKRPHRCYWLALIQAGLYISRTNMYGGPYHSILQNYHLLRTEEAIRLQLIWPSELGGLPIIGCYSFLYKGGGDPLSKSLASLKMLQGHFSPVRRIIHTMKKDELYDGEPSLESLIQDPYGLPVRKPKSPDESVSEGTLEVIKSISKNKDILDVLKVATPKYKSDLLAAIQGMSPFNPVIARDLYDCSVFGSIDTIKRMFLKTRTLQAVSRGSEDNDLVEILLEAGAKQIIHQVLLHKLLSDSEDVIVSLYKDVIELRSRWSSLGVLIEGVTSYMPIDFKIVWGSPLPRERISVELHSRGQDIHYKRGPNRPYLGTRTVEKRSEHGYKIIGKGFAVSALKTLQSILSWADHTEGACNLIDYLSQTRAGLNLSDYTPLLAGVLGGNQGHRYAARIGQRDAHILGDMSTATWCVIDSNEAGFLSATVDDYPVMFQEFFLFLISLLSYSWDHQRIKRYLVVSIIIGNQPLDVLPVGKLEIPMSELPPYETRGMVLVQTEDIRAVRTGGPLWESEIMLHEPREKDTLFPALISALHRGLAFQRHLVGVLDHTVRRIKVPIGLPELLGMGIETYLNAAAIVLIECSESVMHSPANRRTFNASVGYLNVRVGGLLVDAILPYLSHPGLRYDPVVQSTFAGPSPQYQLKSFTKRQLISIVSSKAVNMIQDSSSLYYRTPVMIFGSDTGEATLGAFIRRLRQKAMKAHIMGIISESEMNYLVGSAVKATGQAKDHSEAGKLSAFRKTLEALSSKVHSKTKVMTGLGRVAFRVVAASIDSEVFATSDSADEVVRLYREMATTSLNVPYLLESSPLQQYVPTVMNYSQDDLPSGLTLQNKWILKYKRAKGRPFSLGSGAMTDWLPLHSLFKGQDVLVIGSGLGACAATALLGGALTVWGHDLAEDFVPDTPLGSYEPPLCRVYNTPRRYQQTELSVSTSGDWFDPEVAYYLCRYQPTPYLLVIDISSSEGYSPKVIQPLVDQGYKGTVLLRIQGTEALHAWVTGAIHHHGIILSVFQPSTQDDYISRIYMFTISSRRWGIMYSPSRVFPVINLPQVKERTTVVQLLNHILGPLGGSVGRTVREALWNGIRVFRQMIGPGQYHPTYHEWTETLRSALACEYLLLYDEATQERWITTVERQGTIRLISYKSHLVYAPPALIHYITTVVCRLSKSLDNKI